MQLKGLHKSVYQLNKIVNNNPNFNEISNKRILQLEQWKKYKAKGLSSKDLQEITGISQTTYYRLRKQLKSQPGQGLLKKSRRPHTVRKSAIDHNTKQIIFKTRKENPTYGKAKIHKILERDHEIKISASTVGRVISKAIRLKQIERVTYKKTKKRTRIFDQHAKRWTNETRKEARGKIGQLIQIDHMTVTPPCGMGSMPIKHFTAYDRISKMVVHEVYSRASSSCAARFLDQVLALFPFPVVSIQVDGGSEFMKDFEAACQEKNIPLFVLPPRSPKLNGGVERCNRTSRHEFYQYYEGLYTLAAIRPALERYTAHYNTFRPHSALDLQTPFDYYQVISRVAA